MATRLSISTDRREDGAPVVTAAGEIDLTNIDAFAAALDDACTEAREGATATVDLSGVEYLDSGGINVLFAHANDIHVIANPILMPVLKISGLTDVASVESAGPQGD
jgi:anti-anti-sigma factor